MIDLKPFCASPSKNLDYLGGKPWDAFRFRPWTRGERTYATDSYILLSVPARTECADEPQAPDAPLLFAQNPFPPADYFQRLALPADARETTIIGTGLQSEFALNMERYPVGRRVFPLWMLCRMATLPDLEVATFYGDDNSPLHFRFANDGKGLAQPFKQG